MRTGPIVVASAASVLCLVLGYPASAQVTAVNGDIAYTVCEYSVPAGAEMCDIWVMHPDGSDQRNLTDTPEANEMWPAWSPDGTRIAYIEGTNFTYTIMVMNADGTGKSPVVPTPSYQFGPTWSADGTQIAFTRLVEGQVITLQFDILVINVDGTGETNLTNSDYDELDAAWSPDGTRIAFAGVRPEMSGPDLYAQWEIVTVNPDGSDEQILTAGEPGTARGDLLEEDRAPAWAPDSSMLVYMTQSVDPCCPPWQMEKVNRDGTGILLLSDNPAFNDISPSFSPDGTLIIFVSDRGGSLEFYTMPAPVAGSAGPAAANAVKPLPTPANASDPVWGRKPQAFEARPMKVDVHGAGGSSNLNGVLEPGESVIVEPTWQSVLTVPLSFNGTASAFTGPAGPSYVLDDILALRHRRRGSLDQLSRRDSHPRLLCHDRDRNAPCGPLGLGLRGSAELRSPRILPDLDAPHRQQFSGRPDVPAVLHVRRKPLPQRNHRRLRGRRLLPGGICDARPDVRLPAQVGARRRLCSAGLHRDLRRRCLPEPLR